MVKAYTINTAVTAIFVEINNTWYKTQNNRLIKTIMPASKLIEINLAIMPNLRRMIEEQTK